MPSNPDPIIDLFDRHEELGLGSREIAAGGGLSGWQCINPYARGLQRAVTRASSAIDKVSYAYLEDDVVLQTAILDLHSELDGTRPSAVHAGAGANSLLFTFAAFLKASGVQEIYFVPPLYFAMRYALKLLGIRARPVSAFHAFEPEFSLNLPDRKTYLLLADPIWYAGIGVAAPTVDAIRIWQAATGSTVFVDGSFQYMAWNHQVVEPSASLAPEATFRVLCPTKALAIHGYRFAYLLLPAAAQRAFSEAYNNIYASASAETLAFAHVAIGEMRKRTITNKLAGLVRRRHSSLRRSGITLSLLQPDRGYFVFEKLNKQIDAPGIMDGSYFEQSHYPGYVRLNLLSPSLGLLSGSH